MFSADVFAALTHTFHIGYNYVRLVAVIACIVPVGVVIIGSIIVLLFCVCPVQSPCWILSSSECLVEVTFFLLKQLVVGTDCLGSVFKGVHNTELSRQVVVTVPLQVQICVCGLSKHQCKEGIFRLWHHYCIHEWKGPLWFGILCCKLDVWVHVVDVLKELLSPYRIYDYKSVIHISLKYFGEYSAVLMALISKSSIWRLATMVLMGDAIAAPWSCSKNLPWNWK